MSNARRETSIKPILDRGRAFVASIERDPRLTEQQRATLLGVLEGVVASARLRIGQSGGVESER